MSVFSNAGDVLLSDQVAYYSDMTLWEIRIGGLVFSVLSALATTTFLLSDCVTSNGLREVSDKVSGGQLVS